MQFKPNNVIKFICSDNKSLSRTCVPAGSQMILGMAPGPVYNDTLKMGSEIVHSLVDSTFRTRNPGDSCGSPKIVCMGQAS